MSSFLTKLRVTITLWIFWILLSIKNLRIARILFDAATAPQAWQKPWITVDPQEKTCIWFLEGAASLKQEELYDRIRKADIVLFWSHGGAIVFGSATQNATSFIKWIKLFKEKKNMNIVVCGAEYRLTPENPAPAQYEDIAAAYTHIIKDLGVDPKKIVMGGDSAGSLLCPDAIVYSRVYKDVLPNNGYELPLPAGMIFSSPISGTLEDCPSVQENRHKDFNPLGLPYIENYINNASSKVQPKPWAFLKEGSDLSANIPKHILVFVGGHEIGRDDNIYIADAFKKAGADTTVIREEYPHNWFLLGPSVVDEPSVNEKADAAFANWVIQTTGAI